MVRPIKARWKCQKCQCEQGISRKDVHIRTYLKPGERVELLSEDGDKFLKKYRVTRRIALKSIRCVICENVEFVEGFDGTKYIGGQLVEVKEKNPGIKPVKRWWFHG